MGSIEYFGCTDVALEWRKYDYVTTYFYIYIGCQIVAGRVYVEFNRSIMIYYSRTTISR